MNNPPVNWSKLDPVAVSTASPRHIQSVLEDALETIATLQATVAHLTQPDDLAPRTFRADGAVALATLRPLKGQIVDCSKSRAIGVHYHNTNAEARKVLVNGKGANLVIVGPTGPYAMPLIPGVFHEVPPMGEYFVQKIEEVAEISQWYETT